MAKTYVEKLQDPRWQKKRLEILNRDSFKCVRCRDSETQLHVHHLSYHGEPWEAPSEKLETLCKDCHTVISQCDSINFIPIIKFKDKYKIMLFTGDIADDGEPFISMYLLNKDSIILSSFEIDYNQFEQLKGIFKGHFEPETPSLNG